MDDKRYSNVFSKILTHSLQQLIRKEEYVAGWEHYTVMLKAKEQYGANLEHSSS